MVALELIVLECSTKKSTDLRSGSTGSLAISFIVDPVS